LANAGDVAQQSRAHESDEEKRRQRAAEAQRKDRVTTVQGRRFNWKNRIMSLLRSGDAFGLEMQAYLNGGSPVEIVERDDGYIDAANNVAHYFAGFGDWPARQRRAMRSVKGQNALDIGCGAGRVALYLQSRGIRVTAIDASARAIRICRRRGVKDAKRLRIEGIGALRTKFDTVVLLGNNFGLFGDAQKARRLLGQLHNITSDQAVVIAETINPYKTTNPFHRRYRHLNRQRRRMPGQIRIRIRFQGYVTPWFDYLFVSPNELKGILRDTGWKAMRFFEDAG